MKRSIFIIMLLFAVPMTLGAQFTNTGTVIYDGIEREFNVFFPSTYDAEGDPVPALIVFHGAGGNASSIAQFTGFNEIAEREGFVAIYPSGPGGYWDYGAGTVNWEDVPNLRDDPGFLAFLLPTLQDALNIDPTRIYATGYSNGARMAFRLGCDLSDQIAAIAAVSATISDEVSDNCPEESRVSVLYMHGTADDVTPWEGKPLFIEGRRISTALSAPDTVTFWAGQNGCSQTPEVDIAGTRDNIIGITHYTDCENGREVRFHPIYNGGHSWFSIPNADFDASEVIWEFFAGTQLAEADEADADDAD